MHAPTWTERGWDDKARYGHNEVAGGSVLTTHTHTQTYLILGTDNKRIWRESGPMEETSAANLASEDCLDYLNCVT